ncbi:hypothetical protein UN679_10960 [Streptococcus suis]|uniref:hypothetical protein n=1 Tax=Streptococcus suis TaxID=1307 RepID=UPI002AB419D2|nr:hypothetical protein [Streptococcus suis]MDY7594755.1 hypothetical protein [Streptococcus suis]
MVGTVTFNQAMLAKDRVFAIRAGTYTSSDIKEASFNYGYISGDAFKPGGTVAGSAKLTFTSIITTFNKLDKIYPEIGLLVGDSYEWVAMGEYFVNDISIDRNRNTTELDLMDGMFKLNQPYVSDLTYPAQIRDVIREICVKTGIELETDNLGLKAIQRHIEAKADKNDITFREVLSQAIQLLGFSAFFNRQGKLEVRGLTESRITVTADNYFLHGLTKSEIQYQIAGITCKKDKETLTVGLRTGRSLELENSFMNQNLLDELYYELKDIKYYPFSLDWQGHLKLDVGQWVTLKTNKNETYKVPVLSQSFSFKGGLKSKISADSKAGNDTQYAYKGFLGKRIEQMSTEIEAEVQQQLEYKDKEFDEKINKVKSEINDGIEQAQAEAERHADAIKQAIDTEITQVNQSMQAQAQEHDRQVADILTRTGANTDLANVAKQLAERAQADLATIRTNLTGLIAQTNTKAGQLEQSITSVRADVASQARSILAQAQAQTALTNRVTTVETLADGTRLTVAELSKTVSQATGDIASVSSRTKTVEDGLVGVNTRYTETTIKIHAQTEQITTLNAKTAQLESGLNGVKEKFENIKIDSRNYFSQYLANYDTSGVYAIRLVSETQPITITVTDNDPSVSVSGCYFGLFKDKFAKQGALWLLSNGTLNNAKKTISGWPLLAVYPKNQATLDKIFSRYKVMVEIGNVSTDWVPAEEDFRHELATYVRNAEEDSAELSRRIETVDGKAVDAKTYAQQTADAINTRLESLETYKDAEGTRASQYFTASRDETARQVSALRVAVTQDYVAKSVFEETARGISQRFESLYVGGTNLLTGTDEYTEIFNSEQSHAEFLRTPYDLAPVFDKYGLIEYTLSFDLRASQTGQVAVYQQNGSGSKYSGLWKNLTVTTEWQRFHVTFTPTEGTVSLANSYLAFYGTYGTGVKPIIRRAKIERGAIATDWSPAPEDQQSYADTKIAEYKTTVDGRFATLQSQKANQVDLQTVRETVNLYERIIGSTETGIKDKVARMVMTDSLFLTEVKDKISGTATQVSQLNNSYAIKNLTSAGTVLNQINLLANGTNRIDGRLTHITGQTLIDNGVINTAMIGELDAGKLTAGYISSDRFQADSITGDKLVMDSAFFNKFAADEAKLKQLFAKNAFITQVQAVNLSAKQIAGGIAKALNGGMDVNFDESKINFYTNVAAIRRIYTGHPTQFIKFETEGNYSRTIIGSNRNGGEVFNSATFAGIVVENTNNINTEDNVRVYGDNTLFRHAQGDVGWNINSVTQRIVPANINAESEIWSKHFVAPDKNSKPVRLDTAVAALWDIWNHIIYNNFEFNEALRTHIKARRDNWKFELNL